MNKSSFLNLYTRKSDAGRITLFSCAKKSLRAAARVIPFLNRLRVSE